MLCHLSILFTTNIIKLFVISIFKIHELEYWSYYWVCKQKNHFKSHRNKIQKLEFSKENDQYTGEYINLNKNTQEHSNMSFYSIFCDACSISFLYYQSNFIIVNLNLFLINRCSISLYLCKNSLFIKYPLNLTWYCCGDSFQFLWYCCFSLCLYWYF